MSRPSFLDQPEAWTRATRDSRSIARQSTPIEGPFHKPKPLGHKVAEYLGAIILVVMVVAITPSRMILATLFAFLD